MKPHLALVAAAILAVLLAVSCTSPTPSLTPGQRDALAFESDGLYTRFLRLRTAPSHTRTFEFLLENCADASNAVAPADGNTLWLCYHEPPGRYWLVHFSPDRDGLAYPRGLDGFVQTIVGRTPSADIKHRLKATLAELAYEIEWDIVVRQKKAWCTVDGIDTDVYRKARMIQRTIEPVQATAFESALAARTKFLAEHDYPLPIEGFVTLEGDPRHAYQVVFPRDWGSFHDSESFQALARSLPFDDRDEYEELNQALLETMTHTDYFDANFEFTLSYLPPKPDQ